MDRLITITSTKLMYILNKLYPDQQITNWEKVIKEFKEVCSDKRYKLFVLAASNTTAIVKYRGVKYYIYLSYQHQPHQYIVEYYGHTYL